MALAPYPWLDAAARELVSLKAKLPNSILLYGPRGIGVFELAWRFAKSLLCVHPDMEGAPCCRCHACTMLEAFTHPDLAYVLSEAEALPRGIPFEPPENSGPRKSPYRTILIHQVRALADFLSLNSHEGGLRIVLVYPADQIRPEAAASLLKSIEEPPENVIFILAAEVLDDVLPTIRSRCRLLRVAPPTREQAVMWLEGEGVRNAAEALAEAGGMPLSVSELDSRRVLGSDVREKLLSVLRKGAAASAAEVLEAVPRDAPLPAAAPFLARWAWDLASAREGGPVRYFPKERENLERIGRGCNPAKLYPWINSVRDLRRAEEHPLNSRIVLDAMLLAYIRAVA